MHTELSGSHRKIYDQLFAHPMPQNLDWRDVLSLLKAMPEATVNEEHDSHVKFTRAGETLTLHKPRGKDFSGKTELAALKHFLERTDPPPQPAPAAGTHLRS